jgi:hypothetical protein
MNRAAIEELSELLAKRNRTERDDESLSRCRDLCDTLGVVSARMVETELVLTFYVSRRMLGAHIIEARRLSKRRIEALTAPRSHTSRVTHTHIIDNWWLFDDP